MAGRDFAVGFWGGNVIYRFESLNRIFGLNKTSVNKYFDNLETVSQKYNFQPHQIFNVDKSGLTYVHMSWACKSTS